MIVSGAVGGGWCWLGFWVVREERNKKKEEQEERVKCGSRRPNIYQAATNSRPSRGHVLEKFATDRLYSSRESVVKFFLKKIN